MSEADTKPGIAEITDQEVMDHVGPLLEKAGYKCPICGNKTMIFATSYKADGKTIQPYQMVASYQPTHSFAVLPFVCEQCGYITSFAHKIVGERIRGA